MPRKFRISKLVLRLCIEVALGIILAVAAWNILHRMGQPVVIPPDMPILKLEPTDRILIMAPHPDDEVIGCGGVIQQARAMNIPVRVVFLTYGDFNQWSFLVYRDKPVLTPTGVENMGMVRHDEAEAADKLLGLSPEDLVFLGYPDSGTLPILLSHWRDSQPYRGILTHANAVPYADALRPSAPFKGEEILQDMKTVIQDFRPTKIFVSHPVDRHPDHEAMYLFTRVALWDLNLDPQPELLPYLVHFKRWPSPKGFHPDDSLTPPTDLSTGAVWLDLSLNPLELARKLSALMLHRTQFKANPNYITAFARMNEIFGQFPDFTIPRDHVISPIAESQSQVAPSQEDQLTETEKASFIGFEQRIITLAQDKFEISLLLSRSLAADVGVSVYALGYRHDIPFSRMPKIQVRITPTRVQVLDQSTQLPVQSVEITRQSREITLKIPLSILGDPEHILTGARSFIGDVPLDYTSWRTLEITTGG